MYPRTEMLDLVVIDGHAKGIVVRNLITGEISSHAGDAVVLATGGYGNVFFLSTNAKGCNVTATWRAYKRGAFFANPCYTQIHPTCIPVSGEHQSKLTLMSESLRNDGRVWVPKRKEDCGKPVASIPEDARDYFLERKYPSFGNLAPRDISSRAAKEACDQGRGVGPGGLGVYLDFADSIKRLGENIVRERYGNLFDMYERSPAAASSADADLPGRPLRHGRHLGGLQSHDHPSGFVCARGGEFLRSRGESPGSQRFDAGPGGRLLRVALHHRRLFGDRQTSQTLHRSA
jgi:succinate dehydrogenase/fumarate reductase flavoprotein subunit